MKVHFNIKINNFRKYLASIVLLAIAGVWSGCEKDYSYVAPPIPVNTEVSFKDDIYPIFNTNCNLSGCHLNNDFPPDLTTAAIAYDQMWVNDNGNVLIDTLNDENSILYNRLIRTGSGKMPPAGNLPDNQISLVLTWIKQGAKNN